MTKHRGRKRKQGARHKNGQLKRAAPQERGWENMRTVLTARCARRGIRASVENMRKMRDAREGYTLGRLLNDDSISEGMHDAGVKFQACYRAWVGANQMQRINAPASSYGLTVAGRSETSDKRAAASQDEYFAVANALAESGMIAEWETKRVCLEDMEPKDMEALRLGLDVLRKFFE